VWWSRHVWFLDVKPADISGITQVSPNLRLPLKKSNQNPTARNAT